MITLAIIIGISNYKEKTFFKKLPAAKSDAAWLKRTLLLLGIEENNIKSLVNDEATKYNIKSSIRQWAYEKSINQEDVRLFIFFSGHGEIITEPGTPPESVLITHDTLFEDKIGTGIPIYELVRDLRRIAAQELYIFLDACFMSLNSVARSIGELPSLDLFKRISSNNCFLCMVANEGGKSIERKNGGLGFFMNTIIEGFNKIHTTSNPSISSFINFIQSHHKAQKIGTPTALVAGSVDNWFFSNRMEGQLTNNDILNIEVEDRLFVQRAHVVDSLSEALKKSIPQTIVVTGVGGIGKTTLVKNASKKITNSIYYQFDSQGSYEDNIKNIIFQANNELINLNISATDLLDTFTALQLISAIANGLIIFIDTNEKTDVQSLERVVNKLRNFDLQICIAIRESHSLTVRFQSFVCPIFSYDECKNLINKFGITDSQIINRLYSECKGNPLTLRRKIGNFLEVDNNAMKENRNEYIEIAKKVFVAGSFIDSEIFCKYLSVDYKLIKQLKREGLIYNVGEIHFPHDKFVEGIQNEEFDTNILIDSIKYWTHEAKVRTRLLYPNKQIIDIVLKYRVSQPDFDNIITDSIEKLWQANESLQLSSLFELFFEKAAIFNNTISSLAYIFSEIGEFKLVDKIYDFYKSNCINWQYDSSNTLLLAYSRSCWWKGDYDNCISISEDIMKRKTTGYNKSKAMLEAGIGYFFLGNWDKSKELLVSSENMLENRARTFAWCKLINGTIDCIRGIDFEEGEKRLEDSILILREEGDITGLAIAYGNLGESLWKKGDYQKSKLYLEKNYEYATKSNMLINAVESMRNQLQVEIRWHGPFTILAESLISELSNFSLEQIGTMEMMQVSNTLATSLLYRNDVEKAKLYLDLASSLTCDNPEYHIYTLGNLSMLSILTKDAKGANHFAEEFMKLANSGDNVFAKKQIQQDIQYLYERYGLLLANKIVFLITKSDVQ